jgi:LPXTG-motif cell wall-anchored protein
MGNKVVICHWDNGGHWEAIEVATSSLNAHDNHDLDIWPPIEGGHQGMNWPKGEAVYLNGCVLASTPGPSPSGSPSETLPETGASLNIALIGAAMVISGAWLKWKGRHR